ncbi:MAG: hypothetical protein P4L22_03700 [Candidatus Babeliales bacterium]|nr:hypothetical protein [Candidatus Babeliales bacterium]
MFKKLLFFLFIVLSLKSAQEATSSSSTYDVSTIESRFKATEHIVFANKAKLEVVLTNLKKLIYYLPTGDNGKLNTLKRSAFRQIINRVIDLVCNYEFHNAYNLLNKLTFINNERIYKVINKTKTLLQEIITCCNNDLSNLIENSSKVSGFKFAPEISGVILQYLLPYADGELNFNDYPINRLCSIYEINLNKYLLPKWINKCNELNFDFIYRYDNPQCLSNDFKKFAYASLNGISLLSIQENTILNLYEHTKEIYRLVFSPDDKLLFSCSQDKTIIVWGVETGEKIKTLEGHTSEVLKIAVSSDNKYLVSLSPNEVKLWNLENFSLEQNIIENSNDHDDVKFSSDSRTIYFSDDNKILYWDLESRTITKVLISPFDRCIMRLAISKDNKYIAAGHFEGGIVVWDIQSGQLIKQIETNSGNIYSVQLSRDGEKIFATSEYGQHFWYNLYE